MCDAIASIIFRSIADITPLLSDPVNCSAGNQTALFGEHGQLDSMSLVSLIVAIEEKLESEMGVAVTLASDRAMSSRRSPFATVASLTDFIQELMLEEQHAE